MGIVIFIMVAGNVYAENFKGIGLYGGDACHLFSVGSDIKGSLYMVNGIYGKYIKDDLSISTELGIGQYTIDFHENIRALTAQIKGLMTYDIIQTLNWNWYGELGVGLAYLEDTPDKAVVDNKQVPAIYQWGFGARNEKYIIGMRFIHISGLFSNSESGFDTIGLHIAYLF